MRTVDLIHRKRDGEELSAEEIAFLVDGYTGGTIPDYQMSAFLMAVFFSGMTDREVSALTERMVQSGETVDLSSVPGVKVDKHSTGGVGDKTSLIAAPLAAAAGVVVPMISGRALGHTGGTLDKLEAIPGFRTNLGIDQFREQLLAHKLAFIGQTPEVAPADGKLYALRDATATVESIPLIASSIMSKKLAAGLDALVLDVKVGAGAFVKRQVDARRLAQMMVGIGRRMDKRVQALITDMNQPLGAAVGNALEVIEAIETLQGRGPGDLAEVCRELTAQMFLLGGIEKSIEGAREKFDRLLAGGYGLQKFAQVIAEQGGDARVVEDYSLLPAAQDEESIVAAADGVVAALEAEAIGRASMLLGAGRERVESKIDHSVGLVFEKKVGDPVTAGERICAIYSNDRSRLPRVREMLRKAVSISPEPVKTRPLVLETLAN